MNRELLIEELRRYRPEAGHEWRMHEAMIDFILRHEDCASRSLPTGHLTGSAWIVNPAMTHTLLTHHRRLDLWVQLGGHVEDDADMLAASRREAHEESGLAEIVPWGGIFDLDIHEIPERPGEPRHFHYDIRYMFHADHRAPLIVSSESKDLAWVELERIGELTNEESIRRMVRKTRSLAGGVR
jgi:8-oxo-dGTP pyrophosphatase MutT (NUDIX family)